MPLYVDVERIDNELAALGIGVDEALTPAQLFPFDQYHYHVTDAVHAAVHLLGLGPASHVLDVGSGLGGPARYLASTIGCHITALELQSDLPRWRPVSQPLRPRQRTRVGMPHRRVPPMHLRRHRQLARPPPYPRAPAPVGASGHAAVAAATSRTYASARRSPHRLPDGAHHLRRDAASTGLRRPNEAGFTGITATI
jgi:hypothetical protein